MIPPLAAPNDHDDKLREECAIFGIYGSDEANVLTALGLHALQHRGQEACGIVTCDGRHFHAHRGLGHVGENFNASSKHLDTLVGHIGIGHNRYSTSGKTNAILEVQPFSSRLALWVCTGTTASDNTVTVIAHQYRQLIQSSSDTEIIAQINNAETVTTCIDALRQIEGAYSLHVARHTIGVRDPLGIRPVLGNVWQFCWRRNCALDIVEPILSAILNGEMVVINSGDAQYPTSQTTAFCVFEYLALRPDSVMEGAASIMHARQSAPNWPENPLSRQISSFRFQILAFQPHLVLQRRRAYRLSLA